MKESGKMLAGLLIFIGLIIWCLAPVFAQTTTFKDGSEVEGKHDRIDNDRKLINSKSPNNLDLPTANKVFHGNQPVASSTKRENSDNSRMHEVPVALSVNAKPSSKPSLSLSLVNDLNGVNIESNQKEALSVFSLDAEKLTHIAGVLSHTTGTTVTEEEVLALAMQLLIENYNADLRELNTVYLKDKVSVF